MTRLLLSPRTDAGSLIKTSGSWIQHGAFVLIETLGPRYKQGPRYSLDLLLAVPISKYLHVPHRHFTNRVEYVIHIDWKIIFTPAHSSLVVGEYSVNSRGKI